MTKEEAIKMLKYNSNVIHRTINGETDPNEVEALDMAITALESESRMRYVQETVNAILNTCDTDSIADKAMRNAARFVQNAIDGSYPDFEELPKMGSWIKYGVPRCEEQHYQCTSCGYYVNFGKWGELYTKEFKYCPNCGCKMQEVD